MRFPIEIMMAVRETLPPGMPMLVRISATDWLDDGWDIEDSIVFCDRLRDIGVDVIDVSTGGISPKQTITLGRGYQAPFAAAIRADCGLPVVAVGDLGDVDAATAVLADGAADLVAIGRAHLSDPRSSARRAAAFLPSAVRARPTTSGELFRMISIRGQPSQVCSEHGHAPARPSWGQSAASRVAQCRVTKKTQRQTLSGASLLPETRRLFRRTFPAEIGRKRKVSFQAEAIISCRSLG